jgi:hypothetical protein
MLNNILETIISNVDINKPDEEISRDGKVYLKRWFIIRDYGKQNLYLHQFVGNDDDKALHTHPWSWASIILKG